MFLAGKNFLKHGLLHLHFLQDFATSSSNLAHPCHYTHNPDFPIFYSYILQRIGINSFPAQNFIMIFILGLGLFYMFLAIRDYAGNERPALLVLAVAVFDYAGVLVNGLQIYRGWIWLLLFANLYYIRKYAFGNKKRHLCLGIFFYFLTAYYDYVYAFFITIIIIILNIGGFYNHSIKWRRLLAYIAISILPAFFIHAAFVIWAVGFKVYLKDFMFTFSNRLLHNIDRAALADFYSSNAIVLWGYEYQGSVFKSLIPDILLKLDYVYGIGNISILISFSLFCITRILLKNKFLEQFRITYKEAKFYVAILTSMVLTCVLFSKHIIAVYIGPFVPFFVFFVTIGSGVFLSTLLNYFKGITGIGLKITAAASCILLLMFMGQMALKTRQHLTKDMPIKSLPGYKALPKYRSHSFVTNFQSPYINYFTDEWAKISWIGGTTAEDYIRNIDYVFERDKLLNSQVYENPEFLFIANTSGPYPGVFDPEATFGRYPLVEKGEDFYIFDLRK